MPSLQRNCLHEGPFDSSEATRARQCACVVLTCLAAISKICDFRQSAAHSCLRLLSRCRTCKDFFKGADMDRLSFICATRLYTNLLINLVMHTYVIS